MTVTDDTKLNFAPFFPDKGKRAYYMAGPCSAESEEQMLTTAKHLAETGIDLFRAGVWKPRTQPNSFEGKGEEGLKWLATVKRETDLAVSTEVANAGHVELALKYGVDVLWIGARSTVSPFTVQEIADSLAGVDIPVMIKNPINPDVKLWIGAVERIAKAGVPKIAAIHRGFSSFGPGQFRNQPRWQIAIELKRLFPDLTLICDSSHISGRRDLLEEVAQKALDLNYDGIMLEVHPNPERALSDPQQQITPEVFRAIKSRLIFRPADSENPHFRQSLDSLRRQMDEIDEEILSLLARRMGLADEIGICKKENNISILQTRRWSEILDRNMEQGLAMGLNPEFITNLSRAVHQESINRQHEVMRKPD